MKKTVVVILILILLLNGCTKKEAAPEPLSEPIPEAAETWQDYYDLGSSLLSEGNYAEAITALTEAISLEPKNPEAYVKRGVAHRLQADLNPETEMEKGYDLALADLNKAEELGTKNPEAYRNAAAIYVAQDNLNWAINEYKDLIKFDKDNPENREMVIQLATLGYLQSGDPNYHEHIKQVLDRDARKAYGAFLGYDEKTAFTLADLNWDGVPELIAGPAVSSEEEVRFRYFMIYTYQDGQIVTLVDGQEMFPGGAWAGPLLVSSDGILSYCTFQRNFGTGWAYYFWDGKEMKEISAEIYIEGHVDNLRYMIGEEQVTGEEFTAYRDEQGKNAVPLELLLNSQENNLKYLLTDHGPEIRAEKNLKREILSIIEVLHSCEQETYCAEWSERSYQRTVVKTDSGLKTSRVYSGSIDLLENEEYDPIGLFLMEVETFGSMEELKRYLAGFVVPEAFKDASINPEGCFEEIEGKLYAIRGGRGYGAHGYDFETLEILSYDETHCTAQCQRMLFDKVDTMMQMTFEKREGKWILTQIHPAK